MRLSFIVYSFLWRAVLLFYPVMFVTALAEGFIFAPAESQMLAAEMAGKVVGLALTVALAAAWAWRARPQ